MYVQKYWEYLLSKIKDHTIDVMMFFTHVLPFEKCAAAYELFAERQDEQHADNAMKIQLVTEFGYRNREAVFGTATTAHTAPTIATAQQQQTTQTTAQGAKAAQEIKIQ